MNDRYKEWCDTLLSGNFEINNSSPRVAINGGIHDTWATGALWSLGDTTYCIGFMDGIFLPVLDCVEDIGLRDIINFNEEIKNKVMEKIRVYEL